MLAYSCGLKLTWFIAKLCLHFPKPGRFYRVRTPLSSWLQLSTRIPRSEFSLGSWCARQLQMGKQSFFVDVAPVNAFRNCAKRMRTRTFGNLAPCASGAAFSQELASNDFNVCFSWFSGKEKSQKSVSQKLCVSCKSELCFLIFAAPYLTFQRFVLLVYNHDLTFNKCSLQLRNPKQTLTLSRSEPQSNEIGVVKQGFQKVCDRWFSHSAI